jgi:hypothetical protein
MRDAIIYLRLSDFRDEEDTTFDVREAELRDLAASLALNVIRVVIENDLDGNGKSRPASAYKTPLRVTANGLTTFRTNRPEFAAVLRQLQAGRGLVLIVGDDSRLSRNERDGADLIDACRVGRASVVAPDDEGRPRWILTSGGTPAEVSAFADRINDARKYSADIAAKVRKGRRRWAGTSYQGGKRPYGFRPDPDAPAHRKTLLVNDDPAGEFGDEAGVLREAADGILDRGVSLKAAARELRESGVPTVTGAAWSAGTLRDVLLKPAVAGLAVRNGELVPAPWEAIIPTDRWERLRDLLTDPARRTNTGRANEPRWLVSVFAACGVCGGLLKVGGGGRGRGPAYVGRDCGHIRRSAAPVDEYVAWHVIERMSRPDAAGLLRPPPRPAVDARRLRAERRALTAQVDRQRGLNLRGLLPDAAFEATLREAAALTAAIDAQLAASDEPDPLPEFRDGRPAEIVWAGLGIARRRAVVQTLIESVIIMPAGRRGSRFDPATVEITPVGAAR